MALLSLGTPLKWSEAKKYADHIRKHGIAQFINTYRRVKDRHRDHLLWGDEVEYILVVFNEDAKTVQLCLRAEDVLKELIDSNLKNGLENSVAIWHPEYAKYMIEGTPSKPYGNSIRDLLDVEKSMKTRRKLVQSLLKKNEEILSIATFPRIGTTNFLQPSFPVNGPAAQSQFIPDEIITSSHPRFKTLTENIRTRRGRKVAINVPIFKDTVTPSPFIDPGLSSPFCTTQSDYKQDHVYMDAMVFGMGCCCLQMTFQACSVEEARTLYDQLAVLTPICLALTAATPIVRGYLVDTDCRWQIIASSVDDRTPEELGEKPLKHDRYLISKSRYDSIDCYISTNFSKFKPEYNDLPLVYNEDLYKMLIEGGIDDLQAKHVAHLFIRDPLVVYSELIDQNDEESMDHFENIQSTNWRTMRFKPPTSPSVGWRVEFRPMEVQLTDFENAAFSILIVLLTRVILSFNLNLYIPISRVDENMKIAQKRNAINEGRFYFRKNVFSNDSPEIELMSMNKLINGKKGDFPGLIPLIYSYLDTLHLDVELRCSISKYLDLISKRASGKLLTVAAWIRKQVMEHPAYRHDSVVSPIIDFDLLKKCRDITNGKVRCPELLGEKYPR